ncbi:BPI fold-containing family B member 3 [Gallus gallus]|uniref:BPI fold containing family B member 3 n=1 Tax=Gallus gallus TaxID=9031 RepID=A0A8V0Z419_CHICK|nr:BPI fold-containing family B member 3 [Gallus gallus]
MLWIGCRRQGQQLDTSLLCRDWSGPKMGVLWVVFLTCGLLTSSQGLPGSASVSARVNKDMLESAITGPLANGNLLQGLLGGLLSPDGLLGGLLGPSGLLGGLLGGDGLVGGLLGGNGLVGGILGGDGPVGGLLGGDGLVGGLLGGDGLVGGLLGGGGPVGGVLGDDGLVGGLVGGDGPAGGLLEGDGPAGAVGGLLGGNGLVGGLLGGGGPVGGLLGGDGLVGGLLGGGLLGGTGNQGQGSLLGGGLLGKDGLLGTVQGLTGLRIVNITLPKITLRFLPGIGLQLNIYTQLLIDGNGAVGSLLQLQVEANITARVRLAQDKSGALRLVVEDCKTLLGDINIRVGPKVPLVEKTLKSVLGSVLPRLLCPVVDTVLGVVNSLLGSVTSVLPLGALGNLQYTLSSLPIIGDKSIQLDLNLLLRDAEGNVVEPAGDLSMPVTLPPAVGPGAQLGLSQGVLGAVLALAQRQGAFSMDISSSAVPNSIPLTTSALLSAFPQLSTVLPGSLPLALRVRLADTPAVAVRDGKATATLRAAIDVLAQRPGFPPQTLFSLDSDVVLDITPSVSGGRLRTALAVDRVSLRLASSQLGSINVSRLEGWVKDILAAAYVPAINNAVGMGIPLPNIFNTNFENGQVDLADNTFVINQRKEL